MGGTPEQQAEGRMKEREMAHEKEMTQSEQKHEVDGRAHEEKKMQHEEKKMEHNERMAKEKTKTK